MSDPHDYPTDDLRSAREQALRSILVDDLHYLVTEYRRTGADQKAEIRKQYLIKLEELLDLGLDERLPLDIELPNLPARYMNLPRKR